ncbi:hypothetical protein ABE438_17330 [Bosea sp. TWI1241]|uniref:hypothetical protein n=1 Tax=Bosea sp. TWI1241 TaxID=3148904 RepID=UPI003209E875
MDFIKPLLPTLRVWLFGAVVWLLARLGIETGYAGAVTDWIMQGVVLLLTIAYGAWASWRDTRANLVARAAALSEVARIVTTPEIAAKVDNPSTVVTRG